MRICFYAPFKPVGHPNPSGDLIIATSLHDFLVSRGHQVLIPSTLRSRWIFLKPWLFPLIIKERILADRRTREFAPDLWLSYHCYYKSPDLLGALLCKKNNLPYCIFQGIYSTKQRRSLKAFPGFYLNRHSLLCADHLFTNRKLDLQNLKRIIPPEHLSYIKPGISPDTFSFDMNKRNKMREKWKITDEPVILSAAMFRPDVKSQGLSWMIKTLAELSRAAPPFKLIIAGDGIERNRLMNLAEQHLPNRVIFTGRIKREKMAAFYSGGDIFAFPGIRESLGMVFLEAQSCGLPVVAFDNGGIPEVVQRDETGFLIPPFNRQSFCMTLQSLLLDTKLRQKMGRTAAQFVRKNHNIAHNYLQFERILLKYAHAPAN